jgi:RNA polymerase sigma factor (TIGR02999 family)
MSEVTILLQAAKAGEPGADERLWEVVYQELRRIGGVLMGREKREVTLSGTALVHEAWLRLCGDEGVSPGWDGRGHFFTAAAEAMRRILVDQARARSRIKRGGGQEPLELGQITEVAAPEDEKVLLVHGVLDELAQADPQKAHIVKLRFFVGFTHDEIASLLGVSEKTVRREWKLAKTWLFQALKPDFRTKETGNGSQQDASDF